MPDFDPSDESAGLNLGNDDELRRRALARLAGAPDPTPDPSDESAGLNLGNNQPLPMGGGGAGPNNGPPPTKMPGPSPNAMSPQEADLTDLANKSITQRLQESLQPPDIQGLKDAMDQGLARANMARIGTAFRGLVAPHGGIMDPGAYLSALQARRNENNQIGEQREKQALDQPVQQYMNIQAQKKLGLEEGRRATEEARALLNEQRLNRQRGKNAAWTDSELSQRQSLLQNLFPNATKERPELIDGLAPDNFVQVLKTLQQQENQQGASQRAQDSREFRGSEADKNRALREQGLGIAAGNLEARKQFTKAYSDTKREQVKQSGQRLTRAQASDIVDGFELAHALPTKDASELRDAHGSTRATIGLINKFKQEFVDSGIWDRLGPTEKNAKLDLLRHQLLPWLNRSEMKGQFTRGHALNLMEQIRDPTAWKQLVNTGRVTAQLDELRQTLPQTLFTRASALGAKPLQGIEEEIKPGRVGTAPAGTPGAKDYTPDSQMYMVTDKKTGKTKPVSGSMISTFVNDSEFSVEPIR